MLLPVERQEDSSERGSAVVESKGGGVDPAIASSPCSKPMQNCREGMSAIRLNASIGGRHKKVSGLNPPE